ncbi:MAG: hypothetical protein ACO3QC_14900 [Phycisphaerales bacterium]
MPSGELDPSRLVREFDVSIAWGVFAFLFLSFFLHAIVSFGPGRRVYEAEVTKEQNRFRWVEYSLSSTIMIIMIAMVFGVTDIAALLGLAGANVSMILPWPCSTIPVMTTASSDRPVVAAMSGA